MYDWSSSVWSAALCWLIVSVVIERMYDWSFNSAKGMLDSLGFSCYWKNVRLKHTLIAPFMDNVFSFSCYWKNVRLKRSTAKFSLHPTWVSVVIERMYDWSSETNWLKINDFWQLVSGLFFENGRSAQKVPLFSKIWGDCLTVFDSCGNI